MVMDNGAKQLKVWVSKLRTKLLSTVLKKLHLVSVLGFGESSFDFQTLNLC